VNGSITAVSERFDVKNAIIYISITGPSDKKEEKTPG